MTEVVGAIEVRVAPTAASRGRLPLAANVVRLECQQRSAQPEPFWRYAAPSQVWRTLWSHRYLLRQLAWRDVRGRYEGSFLGLTWAALQPLLMLLVYVFVFRFIFKATWQNPADESQVSFGLTLLTGLLTFSLGSEVLQRSSGLVLAQPNLVKRVRFPLEVLAPVALLGSCFHSLLGLSLVGLASAVYSGALYWQALYLPLVLVPYVLLLLGCSWCLATLGTFLRDLGQVISLGCQLLVFLTPVLYPLSAVPERFRPFVAWSPFAIAVENVRRVLLWGQTPDWLQLGALGLVGLLVMHLGHALFMRGKRNFADVT